MSLFGELVVGRQDDALPLDEALLAVGHAGRRRRRRGELEAQVAIREALRGTQRVGCRFQSLFLFFFLQKSFLQMGQPGERSVP